MKRAARLPLLFALVLFAGCEPDSGAGIAWNTFWDLLGGEPDAESLAPSAHFEHSGIAFDYPALLRRRERVEDSGQRSWSFEHGMFELELRANRGELSGADFLSVLAEMFEGGERVDSEGPAPGRSETICGHRLTATRLKLKMMDDWSEIQAFDLPAPQGESRVLLFDDEPIEGRPSAVAQATWERVLGSLTCDPSFVAPP